MTTMKAVKVVAAPQSDGVRSDRRGCAVRTGHDRYRCGRQSCRHRTGQRLPAAVASATTFPHPEATAAFNGIGVGSADEIFAAFSAAYAGP